MYAVKSKLFVGLSALFLVGTCQAGDLRNCGEFTKYGPPVTMQPSQNTGTRFLCRKGYSIQHSAITKGALWAAEHVRAEQIGPLIKKSQANIPDPDLPEKERASLDDYADSGFDKGQFASAANFNQDEQALKETYYLSNVAPEEISHNRVIWSEIESYVRRIALNRKHGLFVVTGPVHAIKNGIYVTSTTASACPSVKVKPKCAESFEKKATIGKKKVFVPEAYYKVILDPENQKAIAFVVPNMELSGNTDIKVWMRTVRDVELMTHLDFFSALNRKTRDHIENQEPSLWTR